MVDLSPEKISELTEMMFPQMPAVQTDSAILLGFGPGSGFIAAEAASLFHQGYFDKIVVSGGVPVATAYLSDILLPVAIQMGQPKPLSDQETEACYMRRILLEKGVPLERIHTEGQSQTTIENLSYSKSVVARDESVTLISFASTAPRVMSLARRIINAPIFVTHSVYGFGFNQDNWAQSDLTKQFVLGERNKLDNILCSDDGVKIEWDTERALANSLPPAGAPTKYAQAELLRLTA